MIYTPQTQVAGRTLAEWREFAREEDCLSDMYPEELRALLALIPVRGSFWTDEEGEEWEEPEITATPTPALNPNAEHWGCVVLLIVAMLCLTFLIHTHPGR